MRIAVDAMGTDNRPEPDVAGAVLAAQAYMKDTIVLIGPQERIKEELTKYGSVSNIEIIHAETDTHMDEKPSLALKDHNSSIYVGLNAVKDGNVDAFVTAGNTGAVYAIAMLNTLKRIPNVKRPALSSIFPVDSRKTIFLDIGANSDCKPEWLVQFAIMGQIYARQALKMENPRVGILSNGEEEGKGTQLVKDASELIQHLSLNYVGNVEPIDVLRGLVDVIVTDGFTGNILLKTFEATSRYLVNTIRDEIKASVLTSIGGLLVKPAFQRTRGKLDTFEIGGAPLLGVNGVVIVSHGGSNATAIKNAVQRAREAVEGNVIEAIRDNIALHL
jgi:glycerol-3-phosphate acyltransferase PlsX